MAKVYEKNPLKYFTENNDLYKIFEKVQHKLTPGESSF